MGLIEHTPVRMKYPVLHAVDVGLVSCRAFASDAMKFLCLFLLFTVALCAAGSPTYNVREFGATGDGTTKDTRAFQKALDTCAVSGGGEVLVPAGHYLIGS